MSSFVARISRDMLRSNFAVTSGIDLEVTKIFAPQLALRLKISVRNFDRQPSDVWHSSSASMIRKTFEYTIITD